MVSLAAVSSCGRFVAGACRDGVILVWDAKSRQIILSEKHPKGLAITGMAWNPSGKEELAFVDCDGQLGTLENITEGDYLSKPVSLWWRVSMSFEWAVIYLCILISLN